jgi:hypothetical protein
MYYKKFMRLKIEKKTPLSPCSRAKKLGLTSSRFSYSKMGETAQ